MILALRCSLNPTNEQAKILDDTLVLFNDACNFALKKAKEHNAFFRPKLHTIAYKDLRSMGLSANLAVTAINKVSRKSNHKTKHFKAKSIEYSIKTLSVKDDILSITTVAGRIKIKMKLGNYQKEMLTKAKKVRGGILFKNKKKKWFVNLNLEIEEPQTPKDTGKIVGIDFGQKYIATLSNGIQISGGEVKTKRLHYRKKRSEIQSKLSKQRTKGLKNLWERLSSKEKRFVDHTLHTLTRKIVDSLEPGDTIAIEDLTGIRNRTTKRGTKERYLHNSWPYYRFRKLLEYKAALKGIKVVTVSPEYTSQECPRCGHIDKKNRKNQSLFRCQKCKFQHNADFVASLNIARRAGSMGMGCHKTAPISRISSFQHVSLKSYVS